MSGLFSSLKFYTVHMHPAHKHPEEKAEFIEDGFSFLAFLLGGFWLLYHRLWLASFVFIVVSVSIRMASNADIITSISAEIAMLSLQLLIGLEAQNLRRTKLRAKGYKEMATITAEGHMQAARRFFAYHLNEQHPEQV